MRRPARHRLGILVLFVLLAAGMFYRRVTSLAPTYRFVDLGEIISGAADERWLDGRHVVTQGMVSTAGLPDGVSFRLTSDYTEHPYNDVRLLYAHLKPPFARVPNDRGYAIVYGKLSFVADGTGSRVDLSVENIEGAGYPLRAPPRPFADPDTYFVGVMLLLLAAPLIQLIWQSWQQARLQQFGMGLCPRCRYDLTGNVSGVCPECATPVAAANRKPPA